MKNIERLTEIAFEYRIAEEKARREGIIGNTSSGFQVTSTTFQEIRGNREYWIENRNDKEIPYKYITKIAGMKFYCISPYLLYEGDKYRVMEEAV